MPTMAKKIQSNECSLTAAVWAKLEAKAAEARSVHPAKPIVQVASYARINPMFAVWR
jgi:hypothetical protein